MQYDIGIGGQVLNSPLRLAVPSRGHWHVAIGFGRRLSRVEVGGLRHLVEMNSLQSWKEPDEGLLWLL
jgi:hypothetical protein